MSTKDYYATLGVKPSATASEIRTAYMKKSLEVHPDRNSSPTATREFQELADAYHTLGDSSRRAEYDRVHPRRTADEGPFAHANADNVFGDVFEDLLRPEMGREKAGWAWSILGLLGGAILGFVIANLPGAALGGFAGRQLGAIRDRTGRPVYDSFKELPHARKAQVLAAIAAQVLGNTK